jgi:hypothetical protein
MDDFKEYTVTCETAECENKDIAITMLAPIIDPFFICGPCGQPITNVVG